MSHLLLWINLIFVEEMCGNVFVIFLSWNVNDLSLEIFLKGTLPLTLLLSPLWQKKGIGTLECGEAAKLKTLPRNSELVVILVRLCNRTPDSASQIPAAKNFTRIKAEWIEIKREKFDKVPKIVMTKIFPFLWLSNQDKSKTGKGCWMNKLWMGRKLLASLLRENYF